MNNLTQCNRQWATRPDDERFLSLTDLHAHAQHIRQNSREVTADTHALRAQPTADNLDIEVTGPNGHAYAPTNWAFGQLARIAEAPAGYLRDLPAPLAADCINYGLQFKADNDRVGVLLSRDDGETLRAVTGPSYGRIWNADIAAALVSRFGDGITGRFKVPGEFGKAVPITKQNTTLYAGDRDMFVFLADEDRGIDVPGRRDSEHGTLARGFFVWNSEVGSATFGIATFLFDYVCANRIVWGAKEYAELNIRHTAGGPDRYLAEIQPALERYAQAGTASITAALDAARATRVDDVQAFLAARFTRPQVAAIQAAHIADEDRPIETVWDVVTGATAYARSIPWQDQRIAVERVAGNILAAA